MDDWVHCKSHRCPTWPVQTPHLLPQTRRWHFSPSNSMAEASWQETLRLRLVERNNRESAFAPIIEQCASLSNPLDFRQSDTFDKTEDWLCRQRC